MVRSCNFARLPSNLHIISPQSFITFEEQISETGNESDKVLLGTGDAHLCVYVFYFRYKDEEFELILFSVLSHSIVYCILEESAL